MVELILFGLSGNVRSPYLPFLHILQTVLHSSNAIRPYNNRVGLDISRSEDLPL
jgi:hypothetical protein